MNTSRRRFLRHTAAATGALGGLGLFGNPFVARALASASNRFFVLLFLDGGNDGLNTVTPIDDGSGTLRADYEHFRTGLRLQASELLPIGTDPVTAAQLGLHPALTGLKNLYDQGRLAVIQNCGYPAYSLSHEESRNIWQTGQRFGGTASGWFGRYLMAQGSGPLDISGVTIDRMVAREFRQSATSILALRELESFGFPYDDEFREDDLARRAAFDALYAMAAASGQPQVGVLGATGGATAAASSSYPPLHGLYEADRASWSAAYGALDTRLAADLREVARIINGVHQGVPGVAARFFQVSNRGYDTHADQGAGAASGRHSELHREVGGALELFYNDLADMGIAENVCVLVYSEFNRRIEQNWNGTDHGSQGPVFVLGGAVNGGIYDAHPNISPGALDDHGNTPYTQGASDPWRSRDMRDIYGTVLKHWLGMSPATILGDVLPLDSALLDPAHYWREANFDLPFL